MKLKCKVKLPTLNLPNFFFISRCLNWIIWAGGWMIVEPGISDCLAQYKIKRAAKHTLLNDPKIIECFHRILKFFYVDSL